jgi:hypothetical protein
MMGYMIILVGGVPNPLKNMSSSVGMILPNIWKNKKCFKPPTKIYMRMMGQINILGI